MLNTITVSQLNNYVKSLIENDVRLSVISVSGEISNFKNHFSSGHWYFTLKDKNASVRCVMFRNAASKVKFSAEDGLEVVLKGKVSLYEKDGQYQFYAEEMHPVGEGDLALAFKQTKEKLEREGLFDTASKRQVAKYPKRIAVVTSDTGAAVRDIINIISSRYPVCDIVMCPVLVQGNMAARDMIATLDRVYALDNIDTIIIGRGGGSAEDLHCFNDEALARKIYESPFPVISAVGHETDFTICDFVADVRASTPSHAAELSVPDIRELKHNIDLFSELLKNKVLFKHNDHLARFNAIQKMISSTKIERIIQNKEMEINQNLVKSIRCVNNIFQKNMLDFTNLTARIDALSPLKVMSRGFSVVTKGDKIVTSNSMLNTGDQIDIKFIDGDIVCNVIDIKNK